MYKVNEGRPNVADHLVNRSIDLVINTPLGRESFFDDRAVRRAATMAQVPCITTLTGASAAVSAIKALGQQTLTVRSLQDYYAGSNRRLATTTTMALRPRRARGKEGHSRDNTIMRRAHLATRARDHEKGPRAGHEELLRAWVGKTIRPRRTFEAPGHDGHEGGRRISTLSCLSRRCVFVSFVFFVYPAPFVPFWPISWVWRPSCSSGPPRASGLVATISWFRAVVFFVATPSRAVAFGHLPSCPPPVTFVFFVASVPVPSVAAQSFRTRVDVVQVTVSVTDAGGR
jgi:hypothetical protein